MTRQASRVLASCLALTACGSTHGPDDGGPPDSADICVGRDDGVNCGSGNICLRGSCVTSMCGDGYLHTGEQCDDGNTTAFDGCDSDCTFTCEASADCSNDDPCDGAESCDATNHVCEPGVMIPDGTACASPTVAGGTCAAGECLECTSGCVGTTFPERDFVCAAGTAQPCATTEPAHTDAERTVAEPSTLPGSTLTFVIDTFSIPEAMGGMAAGFNLDQLDSGVGSSAADATCEEFNPDYGSFSDPGHVGVDNNYQSLIGVLEGFLDPATCPGGTTDGCLDARLASEIATGAMLGLVEMRDVDDLQYDSSITVQLFAGRLGTGAACTGDPDCTVAGERCSEMLCRAAPILGASGRIAPGQTFLTEASIGAAVQGDIFDGRVRVILPSFPLRVDFVADVPTRVAVLAPELRFDITTTALAAGQLGGHITIDDLVAAAAIAAPGMEATVRAILENLADLTPSAADPLVCTSLSMGATFSAITAARSP